MNIIDGLQKRSIKIIEKVVTVIGWLLMLGYIFQIVLSILLWSFNLSNFYNELFVLDNLRATINTFLITASISVGVFILIFFWGKYNFKKYAHLRRRKFPEDTTIEKVAEHFDLPISLIEEMQNDKVIELEKTIV